MFFEEEPNQLRTWIWMAIILWIFSSLTYGIIFGPEWGTPRAAFQAKELWSPVVTLIFSVSTALLIAIFLNSKLPTKKLFHPTRARVLGALGFWLVFPLELFKYVPISAGYIGIGLLTSDSVGSGLVSALFANSLLFLGVSYIISCLLCHEFQHWVLRTLMYGLIWCGCVAAVFAHDGVLGIF